MRGLRALLRLAVGSSRSGGWRNALIVGLIGLSVATATAVAVGLRSTRVDAADEALRELMCNVADARIEEQPRELVFDDLPAELQAYYLDVTGGPPPHTPELGPVEDIIARELGHVPVLPLTERH